MFCRRVSTLSEKQSPNTFPKSRTSRKLQPMKTRFIQLIALVVAGVLQTAVAAVGASALTPTPPSLPQAESAFLIEAQTGTVLYALHADRKIPPASLTKLITLQLALKEIHDGRLNANASIVPVSWAWAKSMPPDSSLMFLGPDQHLTVNELLTGLIVDSGNDAAYEVAHLVAGTVPAFARLMNQEVMKLGFPQMHFVEPSGISSRNVTTAREFAYFCRQFIRKYPGALHEYFRRSFTYPKPSNMDPGSYGRPIAQNSRDVLLWDYPGADGLKTGYIIESGYNIASTAVRNGMRLIAVVLGVHANRRMSGPQLMVVDARRLLTYGFDNFTKLHPGYPAPRAVGVWDGKEGAVMIAPKTTPTVVVQKSETARIAATVAQAREVLAPVRRGDELGAVTVTMNGRSIERVPLLAQRGVAKGGFVKNAVDSTALFLLRLLGRNPIDAWHQTQTGRLATAGN